MFTFPSLHVNGMKVKTEQSYLRYDIYRAKRVKRPHGIVRGGRARVDSNIKS